MKKTLCAFLAGLFVLTFSGCKLLEGAASDVRGWDISSCVDDFGTCWELFTDNADKFEGGFVEAMGTLP